MPLSLGVHCEVVMKFNLSHFFLFFLSPLDLLHWGSPATGIDKCLPSPRLSLFPGKKLPTVVCNGMFFTIFINLCKHCSYPSIRCISLKNEWSIEVRSVQHWFWEEQLSLRPVWCLGHASSGKTALKKSLFTLVVDSATTVHQTIFFQ